jgi:hypothetical protein
MSTYKVKIADLNFRWEDKIHIPKTTLGVGHTLTIDKSKFRKWRGYLFFFAISEKYGTGWVWERGIVEDAAYIPQVTNSFAVHFLPKKGNLPKDANDLRARVHPIQIASTLPTDYLQRFEIIKAFLNIEKSLAFQRSEMGTMCNIAAYQFATLMGAYVPRVWWINGIVSSEVAYGQTIREMSANDLFNWFAQYGSEFGWEISENPKIDCQTKLTIAVIKRKPIGHIGVLNPDFTMWQAGAKNTNAEPIQSWAKWFYSSKNSGAMFYSLNPKKHE